jgi:hypothetical protein
MRCTYSQCGSYCTYAFPFMLGCRADSLGSVVLSGEKAFGAKTHRHHKAVASEHAPRYIMPWCTVLDMACWLINACMCGSWLAAMWQSKRMKLFFITSPGHYQANHCCVNSFTSIAFVVVIQRQQHVQMLGSLLPASEMSAQIFGHDLQPSCVLCMHSAKPGFADRL